eukprot:TRINITY_DN37451_c0_g1_i1.p1 TRINITY_DN37451_c0_g1~~TRINITY_DN37451_c0_g1_i1.p1  ORF type:complete len:102 (+),score=25.41 TRINITY_DN37451_c0_g1_i1:37-342(+)
MTHIIVNSFSCFLIFSIFFFFLIIRRPPRSTLSSSSAASDVYKRQLCRYNSLDAQDARAKLKSIKASKKINVGSMCMGLDLTSVHAPISCKPIVKQQLAHQ